MSANGDFLLDQFVHMRARQERLHAAFVIAVIAYECVTARRYNRIAQSDARARSCTRGVRP